MPSVCNEGEFCQGSGRSLLLLTILTAEVSFTCSPFFVLSDGLERFTLSAPTCQGGTLSEQSTGLTQTSDLKFTGLTQNLGQP